MSDVNVEEVFESLVAVSGKGRHAPGAGGGALFVERAGRR